MSVIYVCPLSKLSETVAVSGARHVVTLINAGTRLELPIPVERRNHLFIGFNDICEPTEGMTCPGEEHVQQFLSFVQGWDRESPIVVHCYAGVSRSTAGAFTALCALRPDLAEARIAARLRRRSPQATPNSRFVAIADRLLGRHGKMSAAVRDIGRGADAFEGSVFALKLDE